MTPDSQPSNPRPPNENGLLLGDGGPVPNEGADPVITVEGFGDGRFVVLDAADGSDVLDVLTDQSERPWSVLRADTEGAVVPTWEDRLPGQV